jgi:excisionase family DNA binding protein
LPERWSGLNPLGSPFDPRNSVFIRNKKAWHDAKPVADLNDIRSITQTQRKYGKRTKIETSPTKTERLAYSIQESADMLGVHYFSVYRLVQRDKLKACRVLWGKFLVPRSELVKLLNTTE